MDFPQKVHVAIARVRGGIEMGGVGRWRVWWRGFGLPDGERGWEGRVASGGFKIALVLCRGAGDIARVMKLSRLVPLVALVGASVLLTGCGYNRLVSLRQQADSSWADVENVYQRRADLVPNLVKTVEGAASFEKETLTQVIQARQQVNNIKVDPNSPPDSPQAMAAFQQTQDQLSSALSRLLVTVERYPDIKANANFRDLQVQLEGTENRIAVERRKFNESVQQYNTAIKQFPTILYSGFLGFQDRPYFAARAGADEAPEVNFDFGAAPGS